MERAERGDTAARTIVIVGPTAGGKSALAMALARRHPRAEIVSADSMQVYRGMDIGTAKPRADERAEIAHHLIDCADPHEGDFTLAEWHRLATRAIAAIHGRGGVALVVGGTNLYVRALLEGIAAAPPVDASLREALERLGADEARRELERVDPETASRVHPRDRRRTLRAIEIHRLTGRPASALRDQWSDAPAAPAPGVSLVGLEWPVEAINARINERVRGMVRDGFVDEVRRLAARGPLTRQAREAVGYHEMLAHLEGRSTLEEAVELTKIRSRRLGKQQRTWLRRFRLIPGSLWLDGSEPVATLVERVL